MRRHKQNRNFSPDDPALPLDAYSPLAPEGAQVMIEVGEFVAAGSLVREVPLEGAATSEASCIKIGVSGCDWV
jgi:hypothetical protein